ncbi:hypothetical protein, partial [Escherichia coli]|uniref:hypothetical protein n=1 Tax=Escherichia coli TaxID=562 RepID=UPI001F4A040C
MSQNDIIIRTHYKSPHRLHIDSDIPTPSSEPINQFARQLITLLDTSDLSSMLGNDSNLLIVFYVQIMPDDFVMQLHR